MLTEAVTVLLLLPAISLGGAATLLCRMSLTRPIGTIPLTRVPACGTEDSDKAGVN
ncbi:hypothetical protein [Lentzea atacamensis]|uniref:hypothetical protein n=1 Tax=Lentzea atacamensis TaxID=531938 RepID=UPI0014741671|nr:hypothetical protein [Lentzea atacamensis]